MVFLNKLIGGKNLLVGGQTVLSQSQIRLFHSWIVLLRIINLEGLYYCIS